MPTSAEIRIRQLGPNELDKMRALIDLFGQCFEDLQTYVGSRPDAAYLRRVLSSDHFISVIATNSDEVVGGIAAYELPKFESQRSEIYIYDLAVALEHRRRGIAMAMIQELRRIAAARGAYVIFVQADLGDEPAIALYTKLGKREDVHHFDIPVDSNGTA